MATPSGGWSKVYLAVDPSFNITRRTLEEWENQEVGNYVIWARLYRAKYELTEKGKTKIKDAIKDVIKNLVFVRYDKSLVVILPEQNLPLKENNCFPHPYHALIMGLNHQKAQCLVELGVVAPSDTTVFFLLYTISRQLYVMTIKGLRYNDTLEAKVLVEELVCSILRTSPEIRAIIKSKSHTTAEVAINQVMSIHTSFILLKQRIGMARSWNIYFKKNLDFDDDNYKLL